MTRSEIGIRLKNNGLEPTLLYSNGKPVNEGHIYTIEEIEKWDETTKSTVGINVTRNGHIFAMRLRYGADEKILNAVTYQIKKHTKPIIITSKRNWEAWFVFEVTNKSHIIGTSTTYINDAYLVKLGMVRVGYIPVFGDYRDDEDLTISKLSLDKDRVSNDVPLSFVKWFDYYALQVLGIKLYTKGMLGLYERIRNRQDRQAKTKSDIEKVCKSLVVHTGGSDVGLKVFWRYLVYTKVTKKEAERMWNKYVDEYLLLGALEYETEDYQAFVESKYYIEKGELVGDLAKEPHESLLTALEFRRSAENKKESIKATSEQTGKLYDKPVSIAKKWMQDRNRRTLIDTIYLPNQEGIRIVDNKYYNIYTPPDYMLTQYSQRYEDIEEFIFELFGDDADWMLDYLAHLVQKPAERPILHPVMIGMHKAVDIFLKLVTLLAHDSNVNTISTSEFSGTDISYLRDNTVVIVIDINSRIIKTKDIVQRLKFTRINKQSVYSRVFINIESKDRFVFNSKLDVLKLFDCNDVTVTEDIRKLVYPSASKPTLNQVTSVLLQREIKYDFT